MYFDSVKLVFKPFSKEQACIEIEKLLNHSYYKEVIRFFNENNNAKESFVLSMIGGNIKELYLKMKQKVKKEKYVRSLKRIASKLLN